VRSEVPAPGTTGFPRRDFLVRVGQAGWGMVVAGPWLRDALMAAPVAVAPSRPIPQEPEGLYSGLHWRMLGPFRGGRADAVAGVPGRPNEFYFGAVGRRLEDG
jgi:hypothetical protein